MQPPLTPPLAPPLPKSQAAPVFSTAPPPATLIQNGLLVSSEGTQRSDLLVLGDTIAAISNHFNPKGLPAGTQVLDATGCYVFPGGLDPHTHMEMPFMGTTSSDDFETGTQAALLGGTTTIIDFAMQEPGHTLAETLAMWEAKAQKAVCDYSFHMAITDFDPQHTPDEMRHLVRDKGINSFKLFMAYKQALMVGDEVVLAVLQEAKALNALVLTHCENGDMIEWLVKQAQEQGHGANPLYHALTRPPLVEAEATGRLLDLARLVDTPVYVVHLSCQEALARVQQAQQRGQLAFAETCIQYLTLDESLYQQEGFEAAKWVFSPPLRSKADQEALWQALRQGQVHTVATDHCPFCTDQKAMGMDDFTQIPNGMPGVQHRMELLFSEGVAKGRLSLEEFVSLTSTQAAKLFGLHPRKGTLMVGADADLVIFDPNHSHTLSAQTHAMRCDYSAFEGWVVQGKARTVLRRGEWVVHNGHCHATRGSGHFVPRF